MIFTAKKIISKLASGDYASFLFFFVLFLFLFFVVFPPPIPTKMEDGDDEDYEANSTETNTFYPTHQPQPNPFYVTRRYWKSLFLFPLIVFLLVLAATLPPIFVARSDRRQEEKDRATMELTKAGAGLRNGVYLAFVPSASLGLWVTGRPNFLEQIDNQPVEIADSYFDGASSFQIAARNALALTSPQFGTNPVSAVALEPHGTLSAVFPILTLPSPKPLGKSLMGVPFLRKGVLHTIFSNEFSLEGPLETLTGDILITRFPVFYEASNCSCAPSSPTANDVTFQVVEIPDSLEGVTRENISLYFEYGKLGDRPPPPSPYGGGGGRFPTEVVYETKDGDLPVMFCDIASQLGLMGIDVGMYGVERVNTTIEYLPKCRFFWGFTSVAFDFDLLMSYGGFLDGLEEAGYDYMLTKKGFDGEPVILSQSPSFSKILVPPRSIEIDLPSQTWSLCIVPANEQAWEGDDWKWQLGLAFVGAFFLALVAFVIVFIVAYRNQYLKNIAEEFSLVTSDAMVQKKRAEASEKAAIENEAVAKKFLSTMSHELRTPLNSILAVSELMVLSLPDTPRISTDSNSLIREVSSDDIYENPLEVRDCELIHDSARFLKQIVDDVLDFNKIEMGCLVISPNRFSPALALQSVARLAFPLIKDPSLYFRLIVDPLTPRVVKTDEQRFKQIIMNLASNAIKFIKEGGLTISLSTVCLSSLPLSSLCSLSGSPSRSPLLSPSFVQKWEARLNKCPQDRLRDIVQAHQGEGEGLFVYVDVEDTGPGMTREQQRKIFQPFYQSNPKRDIKAGGSGLGLSICVDLCKVMGGVIWATDPMREEEDGNTQGNERKGGRGTSFRFLLPLLGAEGRVSPDLIESLFVVDGGSRDGSSDSSFCQIEDTSFEEEIKLVEEDRVEDFEKKDSFEESLEDPPKHSNSDSILPSFPSSKPPLVPFPNASSPDRLPFSNSQRPPLPETECSSANFSSSTPCVGENLSLSPVRPSSSPPSSLLRVLLIDDSKLNRLVLEKMLKSLLPCEVDEAENGEEGIQKAIVGEGKEREGGEEGEEGKEGYDLVICDLNMGEGKNGVEVGEELRRRLGSSFVMALFTADVMVELREGERELFEAVLYKPLSRELLIDFLVRFMDGKFFPEDFPPKKGKKKRKKKV